MQLLAMMKKESISNQHLEIEEVFNFAPQARKQIMTQQDTIRNKMQGMFEENRMTLQL